ncbi:inorganic triphosphatase [Halomonas urumqiensis]|uniref:CYTH domain-containing protein n=1 Tax=Halomonas urumqiensis TaxID=1684789 RepID=A0A2N7UP76_9GAMM|nr:CYTH domain-containing protein [Halomonas urumqiensis]PMR82226.1 CYTH domain-containing protein [Halomonas urumqiensis]PTB02997.1 CYTH domain-containing protein [Halomonas urumqiensis]GHE20885.1 hypothetical protein GCM10017767_14060 [Halomonas urumqiensis]
MNQEIELKLALGSTGPQALRRHPLLAGLSSRMSDLGNTYYDTPDATLEARRMALRLRRVDGRLVQTLKTRGEGGGGLSSRGEWEWDVPGPGLDLAGLSTVPAAAELGEATLARLAPRFATDFHRETWWLNHAGSRIELALDEGEIIAGSRRVAIRELELELKEGEPDALWSLALAFADRVSLRPSDTSKAARAGALLSGNWTLPAGGTPAAWLRRAMVALDALADTGEAHWRDDARSALATLSQPLADELDAEAFPTLAFGRLALALSRDLAATPRA